MCLHCDRVTVIEKQIDGASPIVCYISGVIDFYISLICIIYIMFCRFNEEERAHKAELAQLKMRYDSRVAVISEEIQGLQGQVSRFNRERDTFRHMLEGAQRTIADLKASSGRESRSSGSNVDEVVAFICFMYCYLLYKSILLTALMVASSFITTRVL